MVDPQERLLKAALVTLERDKLAELIEVRDEDLARYIAGDDMPVEPLIRLIRLVAGGHAEPLASKV
jgi:hypothetical protein